MTDALTLLHDDHETVEALFQRYEGLGPRAHKGRRDVVDRIIRELSVHAAVEEQVLYPVARKLSDESEDMTLESLEEHHVVKWMLSELEKMDPEHERFDAKVTVLIENVRHHVEEEERDLFVAIREQLDADDLEAIGEAIREAKRTAPTHPHPRAADEPPANVVQGAIAGLVDRLSDRAKAALHVG